VKSRKALEIDIIVVSKKEIHESVLLVGSAASALYQAVDTGLKGGSIEEFEREMSAPQAGQ
jgi:hypothetical protein